MEEGEEMWSLGQWLHNTHFLDAHLLPDLQTGQKPHTGPFTISANFSFFKKLVRKRSQTGCLDYFAARVKILFFLIVTSAAPLQEFSVLMILLSRISGKTQHRKICKDLNWNSYIQSRIFFGCHSCFIPNFVSLFYFCTDILKAWMVGELVSVISA